MAKTTNKPDLMLPDEEVMNKIYFIRGQKVMLDEDLAQLYQIETKRLKEAVKRNMDRFPEDFMFKLTDNEFESLRPQIATSKRGGTRYLPFAFSEQGVAMLSSVLNSIVAIQVNIRIIRIFTKMRAMLLTNREILVKLELLEKDITTNKQDIENIFEALKQLLSPPAEKRVRIGFKPDND